MSTQGYSVTPHPIETLVTWVRSGETTIPEIQCPFVWDVTKVRNLLDSLYQGYSVGYLNTWRNPTVKLRDGTSSAGKPAVVEYEPDTEQVPLVEDGGIEAFLPRKLLPHAPDAWYVPDSVKTGYEISFTRYFYKPQPLRTLEKIRADILAVEKEIEGLLGEIIGGKA